MNKFYENILEVLKKDERFFTDDGEFLRNTVYEASMKMDANLVRILYEDKECREHFFTDVNGIAVFDKVGFGWVINNKDFLPDSYTRYKNKIGLLNERGEFISSNRSVEIAFPYKDCVLEMDSTTESENRKEIFFNTLLMPNEIDRLTAPKVFVNPTKHTKNGNVEIGNVECNDNMIIKGNNLMVLHSLLGKYSKRIKLMYWDILYNTESDYVPYNDSFKHSSWLTMMKNRLEIAKKLLCDDGTICLQCDDTEMAYLKVLCDEIFGRDNYVNTVSVKMKNFAGASGGGEDKRLKKNNEFLLLYAKNYDVLRPFTPTYRYFEISDLVQQYKENNVSWKYTSVLIDEGERQYIGSTVDGSGKEIKIFSHPNAVFSSVSSLAKKEQCPEKDIYYKYAKQIFTTAMPQSSIRPKVKKYIDENGGIKAELYSIDYYPVTGRHKDSLYTQYYKGEQLRLFAWLKDVCDEIDGKLYKKETNGTLWDATQFMNNVNREGGVGLKYGKKPEGLIKDIIESTTEEGDIVLDAYFGTGTTGATALKMNRRFIGIEQLDSHYEKAVQRLKSVVDGDDSGISKLVNWTGGRSFIYCELAKLNQKYADQIQLAKTEDELSKIWEDIQENGFINCYVNPKDIDETAKDFKSLSFDDKKRLFMELLDANQLYVNYCDIDDETFEISEEDKAFTKSFYGDK